MLLLRFVDSELKAESIYKVTDKLPDTWPGEGNSLSEQT